MKLSWVIVVGLTGIVIAWLGSWSISAYAPPPPVTPVIFAPALATQHFQGAGSCAAAACHNGMGAPGSHRSEYTTWATQPPDEGPSDKHARAYEVLFSKTAQRMAKNLRRGKPAHEDSLCLNCHVVPNHDLLEAKGQLPRFFANDGVSCESCHGPGEKWLAEHYRHDTWGKKTAAEKAELGWNDMRGIAGRARVCASCHIGSAGPAGGLGQDAYHDLYAAGHPPLIYEFSSHHAETLHHWRDSRDRDPASGGHSDFEARAWLVGQLVSAESALDLLAWRAADSKRPWPEFGEMDCFACHHNLNPDSWRQDLELRKKADPKFTAGQIPFRPWHYALVQQAVETMAGDSAFVMDMKKLRRMMEERGSDRIKVAAHAETMSKKVRYWIERMDDRPINLDRMHKALRAGPAIDSWDTAAQTYIAFTALNNAFSDAKKSPPQPPAALEKVRADLAFPPGLWSPRDFNAAAIGKRLAAWK